MSAICLVSGLAVYKRLVWIGLLKTGGNMNKYLYLCLLSLVMFSSGCGQTSATSISNTELAKRVQTPDTMLVVLDVRTPKEYASGHVPGAINIPVDQLEGRLNELRARDNAEFVVYCESGRRAGRAASLLQKDGFLNVRHLQGDMAQWRNDGLPQAH